MSVQMFASKARKHWTQWLPTKVAMPKESGEHFTSITTQRFLLSEQITSRLLKKSFPRLFRRRLRKA